MLAGRLGEICALPMWHIFPHTTPVRVKFKVLKGVFGPQEKVLPEGWFCTVVCSWHRRLSSLCPRSRLFHVSTAQAATLLSSLVHPNLSCHSIRRGALQHADKKVANSNDISELSGHRSQAMLQRYLGRACSDRRDAMLRVGKTLQSL
eukprot:c3964_g1_i1.p2 GENE.c3964_g1_i1~~c3964_g1_i1.p2  ORF type:complete len:148 (+),score=17.94 c3964_g1_i1:242-685(+)